MERVETSTRTRGAPLPRAGGSVAERVAPAFDRVLGERVPVRFVFWDGSSLGEDAAPGRVIVHSVAALRRIVWAPGELGVARAYVAGDLDVEGDLFGVLAALRDAVGGRRALTARDVASLLVAASRLGALGPPLVPPPEEVRLRGGRHSAARDAEAITHHYDVGDAFYALVLGPAMTYSCARFVDTHTTLEAAQRAKHDLVCRKLGLDRRSGLRLLDVGCGWGSMAIHAAATYGAEVVAITLSPTQAEAAAARCREAGVGGRVEVRLADYRDLSGETFDAISSIGMFEHVGREQMTTYFNILRRLLAPTGRLLNHAISHVGGSRMRGRRFINRYVFPDGDLIDVADVVGAMERCGFEVRDVEALREHYVETLRAWVANLDAAWPAAVELVGARRARVWRLYMAASANAFANGAIGIHQVLGVASENGVSGMPRTRGAWG